MKIKKNESKLKKNKSTELQKNKLKSKNQKTATSYSNKSTNVYDKENEAISIPIIFAHHELPNQTLIQSTSVWYQSSLNDVKETAKDNVKNLDALKEYALVLLTNETKIFKSQNSQNISNNKWVQTAASVGKLFI